MRHFARFAALDWSGAATRLQPGIALAVCEAGDAAPALVSPPDRHWSREAVLDWLVAHADDDLLIGMDFSTALPFDPQGGYLPGVAGVPRTAKPFWATVDTICAADPRLAATSFPRHPDIAPHFRLGAVTGALFASADRNGRLRVVERHAASGLPASTFNLVGARQVGLASLTGMRVLHRLGGRVPVWPFDPVPEQGPLIVELYTSIAAVAAGRRLGATKMRSWEALDTALEALASRPTGRAGPIDDHRSDALLAAAWLRHAAADARLWAPAGMDAVRDTEGWTFGVA